MAIAGRRLIGYNISQLYSTVTPNLTGTKLSLDSLYESALIVEGSYAQLTDDGLTEWHPAFLELATTLEECAKRYREFCKRYTPKKKKTTPRRNWGSCFLDKMTKGFQAKPKGREGVPGQLNLDLEGYQEVYQVDPLGSWFGSKAAHTFITANGAAMMG